MVTNWALLWWFSFPKCQRRYSSMFPRPNFKCLTIISRIASITHKSLYRTTPDTKRSLKRKTFESFLYLLKTIWSFQQFSIPLRNFFNLVSLTYLEISLTELKLSLQGNFSKERNDKNKIFFSAVVIWGRFISNLSTNILKRLSINDKGPAF